MNNYKNKNKNTFSVVNYFKKNNGNQHMCFVVLPSLVDNDYLLTIGEISFFEKKD